MDLCTQISDMLERHRKKYIDVLQSYYENLNFYINPDGDISCWIRVHGNSREGADERLCGNIRYLRIYETSLDNLNRAAKTIAENPDKYFFCGECFTLKPMEDYADSVMGGWYCKQCAQTPDVAYLIKESHKRGFYD